MRIRGALPWLRELLCGGGRLRCTLLPTALGMVVLSVVAMHQLSFGHDFVAPSAGTHLHLSAHPSMEDEHEFPAEALDMDEATAGIQPDSSSGGSLGDDCPGCGGHSMVLGACLLTLALLVLSWWLAPPRVRHLPPRMRWRLATVATLLGRRVPALSLAELSVLRT